MHYSSFFLFFSDIFDKYIEISYNTIIGRAKLIWLKGSGGVKNAADKKARTIEYFLNLMVFLPPLLVLLFLHFQ